MKKTKIAHNYAEGLFHAAESIKASDRIEAEMEQLLDVYHQTPLAAAWHSPQISKKDKHLLADEALKGAHDYLKKFIYVVIDRNRTSFLPEIYRLFVKIRDQQSDTLHIQVHTAFELSKTVREKIVKRLEKLSGRTVRISVLEEPNIIGGLRLKIQHNMVDGSVLSRLEGLRNQLLEQTETMQKRDVPV